MVMLSGDTHILFDGTYRMKHDSTGRDVLAFNQRNSLAEPPGAARRRPGLPSASPRRMRQKRAPRPISVTTRQSNTACTGQYGESGTRGIATVCPSPLLIGLWNSAPKA